MCGVSTQQWPSTQITCLKGRIRERDSTLWRYRWQEAGQFLCTKIHLLEGVEQPKKPPKPPGNALSNTLLMSRFQNFAGEKLRSARFFETALRPTRSTVAAFRKNCSLLRIIVDYCQPQKRPTIWIWMQLPRAFGNFKPQHWVQVFQWRTTYLTWFSSLLTPGSGWDIDLVKGPEGTVQVAGHGARIGKKHFIFLAAQGLGKQISFSPYKRTRSPSKNKVPLKKNRWREFQCQVCNGETLITLPNTHFFLSLFWRPKPITRPSGWWTTN